MQNPQLEAARYYHSLGYSVVRVRTDGSKIPKDGWKEYQKRRAALEEIESWWSIPNRYGIGIICGKVSQLEVLDFDSVAVFYEWRKIAEEHKPGFLANNPIVQTPEGIHVYIRTANPGRNQKLASDPKGKALIETRGEGGYVIAPGSPPSCHPSGKTYSWIVPLSQVG